MDDKMAGRTSEDFPIRKFNSGPTLHSEAERWIKYMLACGASWEGDTLSAISEI